VAGVGDDVWDWLLGVNLYGPIHCVRSFLPGMQAHGEGGHIVNTAPPDTAAGMSPDEVAARLVHGIRNNAFYIPTHSATRDLLEARHRNVMAGFDAAARFDGQS
jgi:NAD(P)-dependent dehydrogenase (short-subunit alcohol dehydrogenase family)